MRFAYPLLFGFLFIVSMSTWIYSIGFADPKDEAIRFLTDVRSGNLAQSVKHFGGNACRCPAKGGWGSYLIYASGQESNLAFLTGHDFKIGSVKSTTMPAKHKPSLIPWEHGEDAAVDVQISFDQKKYAPLFLPLKIAYGQKMTEQEFNEFLKDPDHDAWKGFTLRLRPGIKPGSIAPPKEPLPPEALKEFHDLQKDNAKSKDEQVTYNDATDDAITETLGKDATEFLRPKEAGPVIQTDGKEMPIDQVESKLPRLTAATLRLHVVRRGQLKEWTIYHSGLMNPVMTEGNKDIALTHDHRPEQ